MMMSHRQQHLSPCMHALHLLLPASAVFPKLLVALTPAPPRHSLLPHGMQH